MMLSFIMPAYKARFIREAISSILNQTMEDWELVVVDDCSPEDLESIVCGFSDHRIKYVRNQHNIGGKDLVEQWNHCLSYASGEWVSLAADDDIYAPEYAESVLRLALLYPQVNVIRSRVEQIDEGGFHLYDDGISSEFTPKEEYLFDWLSGKSFTCIGNFAFRKSALDDIGGFINFPCAFGSDIATPIALSYNGVANTSDMLFKFRQSDFHLSADSSRYPEKLSAITLLYDFLLALDYRATGYDDACLHKKCVFDYFNLVIKNLPLKKLSSLRLCKHATTMDKITMTLRWVKHRLM